MKNFEEEIINKMEHYEKTVLDPIVNIIVMGYTDEKEKLIQKQLHVGGMNLAIDNALNVGVKLEEFPKLLAHKAVCLKKIAAYALERHDKYPEDFVNPNAPGAPAGAIPVKKDEAIN